MHQRTWHHAKPYLISPDEVQVGSSGISNLLRLVGVTFGMIALCVGIFFAFDPSNGNRGSYRPVVLALLFGGMFLFVVGMIAGKIADRFGKGQKSTDLK